MVCYVPARADMWKSHKWLNRATSTGNSWNYTGTRLNGITHGGGIYETNPYQRVNYQEDNGMMSRKMNYDMTAGNAMNGQGRKANPYNVSFNGEPTRKPNIQIVSNKAFAGRAGHYGRAFAGGASEEKMYRYERRNVNYGVPVNSAVIVNVKHSAARDANGNVVMDGERMNSASRDQFGNPQGPKAAPFGDLGALMTYDRHGGLGPAGKPMTSPVGDSLVSLLLMAGLFAAWKKKLL